MIQVINNIKELNNLDKVVELIKKQMLYIGASADEMRIKDSLENALQENKRAVLFISISEEDDYQSFAFGNVSSGLESGGDYLWINELFVDTKFRRLNLASNMLSFIESWCADNAVKYIACSTGEDNTSAQALYIKNAYQVEKTIWVDKSIK